MKSLQIHTTGMHIGKAGLLLLLSIIFGVALLAIPSVASAQASNLFANGSAEVESGDAPSNWAGDLWGTTQATFTYPSGGAQEGNRYLKTEVTASGDGDAKWYPNHIPATAGQTFSFSDYYQSDVQSFVEVEYILTDGTYHYVRLAILPAASSWTQYQQSFTAPANVQSLTLYHFIQAVGTLSVDNYSLTSGSTTPPPTTTNLVLNPSVETENDTIPANWSTQSWGTNDATFTYLTNAGYTGTHSAKVEITSYTDGDAKWMHNLLSVVPGETYHFSDWYQSNTETYVIVDFTLTDDTHYYLGLRAAPASASWKQYTETFQVPYNAKSMSVFHVLRGVGSLTVDDYSLAKITPQGFNRALVSITFDDGWEDNISTALPILKAKGLRSSYFFATQFLEQNPAGPQAVATIAADGHEVGSHSVTHPNLVFVDTPTLDHELTHSKQYLESLVGAGTVRNIATPFGSYSDVVIARANTLYDSLRSTDEGYNSKENFDPYRLKVQNIKPTTTLTEFQSWVNQARQDNLWLVLVYHRVATTLSEEAQHEGEFNTLLSDFTAQMDVLQAAGVAVVTTQEALQEILPQL